MEKWKKIIGIIIIIYLISFVFIIFLSIFPINGPIGAFYKIVWKYWLIIMNLPAFAFIFILQIIGINLFNYYGTNKYLFIFIFAIVNIIIIYLIGWMIHKLKK